MSTRSVAAHPRRPPSPPSRLSSGKRRLRLLVALLLTVVTVLGLRLVQLQGFESAHYSQLALADELRTVPLLAPRGEILDANGTPLALTVAARDIYADPMLIPDKHQVAALLAKPLHLSVGYLLGRLSLSGHFVYLDRAVPVPTANAVMSLRVAGVNVLPTTRRVYPQGPLAASAIGFVGATGQGLGGLEYSWNSALSGRVGQRTYEISNGQAVPIPTGEESYRAAVPGVNLELTIRRDIQWEAQQAISAQVERTGAQSGTVIVMNPRTGALLALATAPGFDPNNPTAAPPADLGDPAASDVYEPGSVNKVITMSAALQTGLVTPMTPITVPPVIQWAGQWFHDAEGHGTEHLTVTGVLALSSNIGTSEIAERLGAARLDRFLLAYGYGRSTNSGLPAESPGLLPPLSQWSGTTLPTVSFGQGVGVTALQVASVYATIANGGVRVTPYIVRGTVDAAGQLHPIRHRLGRRVISARVAAELRGMMEAVTTEGTAPAAQIPGYRIAGKTGTAQRPNGHGGYSGYTASFVGFAPAPNPRVEVEVVLQNPIHGYYGGLVAAPVFHDVMSFVLQTLRIPPSLKQPPPPRIYAH